MTDGFAQFIRDVAARADELEADPAVVRQREQARADVAAHFELHAERGELVCFCNLPPWAVASMLRP